MTEKKNAARPRGTDCAKVMLIICTESMEGYGTPDDPVRIVRQYWDLDGTLLAKTNESN